MTGQKLVSRVLGMQHSLHTKENTSLLGVVAGAHHLCNFPTLGNVRKIKQS